MAAILARVDAKPWPDTVHEVLLEALQFSGFNQAYGNADDKYGQVAGRYPSEQLDLAEACAMWVLGTPAKHRALPPDVCWFYSPCSMKPVGRTPTWSKAMVPTLASGVEPWRFIFFRKA
jgi:hypothetical protein